MRIPQRREDGSHHWLANLATQSVWSFPSLFHHLPQRFELLDLNDVVEIRSRIGEMWTQGVTDLITRSLHFCIENGLDKRHTPTTACSRFRFGFDFANRFAAIFFDAVGNHTLGDIMTCTDL